MSPTTATVEELANDPTAVYLRGEGAPVAITDNGLVLFYLASGSNLIAGNRGKVSPRSASEHPAQYTSNNKDFDQLDNNPPNPTRLSATGLSLREAAELIGVSKSTVDRRIKNGELEGNQQANGDYAIEEAELRMVFAHPPSR